MSEERAATAPVTTNSQNLMRFTRTPEKCAASSLAPMAKIERPIPVRCRTMPNTTARTTKTMKGLGIWVPAKVPKPQSVNCDGKSATAVSPRITYARPR